MCVLSWKLTENQCFFLKKGRKDRIFITLTAQLLGIRANARYTTYEWSSAFPEKKEDFTAQCTMQEERRLPQKRLPKFY